MTNKMKTVLISIAACFAIAIAIFGSIVSIQNRAITLDQNVQTARSAITIQEKRRVDLLQNLVDTAEEFMKRQNEALTNITKMRRSLENGDTESVQVAIQALAEAYPMIQGEANYQQLMTEMALTENLEIGRAHV